MRCERRGFAGLKKTFRGPFRRNEGAKRCGRPPKPPSGRSRKGSEPETLARTSRTRAPALALALAGPHLDPRSFCLQARGERAGFLALRAAQLNLFRREVCGKVSKCNDVVPAGALRKTESGWAWRWPRSRRARWTGCGTDEWRRGCHFPCCAEDQERQPDARGLSMRICRRPATRAGRRTRQDGGKSRITWWARTMAT